MKKKHKNLLKSCFFTRKRKINNFFRTNSNFFLKLKKNKWVLWKKFNLKFSALLYKRFIPNKIYIKTYLLENLYEAETSKVNIQKNVFSNLLTYKMKLLIYKKMLTFFYIKKKKALSKIILKKKHTKYFFNFDCSLNLLLLGLGFFQTIKETSLFLKNGLFYINNKCIKKNIFIQNFDYFKINLKKKFYWFKDYPVYSTKLERFKPLRLFFFTNFTLVYHLNTYLFNIIHSLLPITGVFNFKTLSFIFFKKINFLNQWHFAVNFFMLKRYLKYGH